MRFFLLFLLLIETSGYVWAAASNKTKDKPLQLKHADRMENHGTNNNMWSHFEGNVEFQNGKITIKSQIADYYRTEQRIELKNNVRLNAKGRTLTADRISYKKSDKSIKAYGNVFISYPGDNITLSSKWGQYFQNKKEAELFGRPVFTHLDTSKNDTFTIISDQMKYNETGKFTSALGNVIITTGSIKAFGGKGEYFGQIDNAVLTEKPFFYLDSNYMTGELIKLVMNGKDIKKIFVYNNAQGKYFEQETSSHEGKITEVSGDTIEMVLSEKSIRKIFVLHNAKSYYYMPRQKHIADIATGGFIRMEFENKGVKEVIINRNATSLYSNRDHGEITGKNSASGDTIHVCFKGNKVSNVTVFGGARGTYSILK